MDRLDSLESFVAVVEAGQFSAAAVRLGIGKSVLSRRVSDLEDRLTALEATAPDEASRLRARTLRDAVRTGRRRVSVLITAGQVGTLGPDLDEVAADVDRALVTSQPAW